MSTKEVTTNEHRRVLIVDDDQQLRDMLAELLALEGYQVSCAKSGADALAMQRKEGVDLWILDVMMPGFDGYETLTRLREHSRCPVIMLTARGEPDDRILGLELGADDYLAKPFSPRELLLRVKAILQRTQPATEHEDGPLTQGKLVLEPARLSAQFGDVPIKLTTAELLLLEALMRSPGEAVSRERLNQSALGRELTPYDRALDTHISNLRRKLSDAADQQVKIRSVRSKGYLLVLEAES